MTHAKTPVEIATAWQEAVNAQDKEKLLGLSHPEIEIVGPRGTAHGHEILLTWLERAGLSLETKRTFAGEDSVVLAQHGVWRNAETGEVQGEADVATSFRIENGKVAQLARYDTLDEALAQAGLSGRDEAL